MKKNSRPGILIACGLLLGIVNLGLAQQGDETKPPFPIPADPSAETAPGATTEAVKIEPVAIQATAGAADNTIPTPAPAAVESATEGKAPAAAMETTPTALPSPVDDMITMTVSDAKIQDVLRSLAAMRPGTNILMGPDVQGTVSFALKDVTWDMAIQLITESNGFQATREGENIYRIHKPEPKAKADITIELLNKSDVAQMSAEDLIKMVSGGRGGADIKLEDIRNQVMQNPSRYIKSLQVENRTAIEIVSTLAKKGNLNFAFSSEGVRPPISGTPTTGSPAPATTSTPALPPVSINLKYISVVDAISLVAAQGGLSCIQQNGVWVVKPMPPQQLQQEPQKTMTFEVKFLPLDDDLIKLCQKLLSSKGTASAGKNKILVVRDTADGIEAVRQALEVMDRATPQVVIEARFFELQNVDSRNLGINWNALKGVDTSKITLDVTVPPATLVEEDFRSTILDVSNFGVILSALQDNSNAKQLSNPKIVVSSDQQATIHIGDQIPIVKSTTTSSSGGTPLTTFELDGDYGGETIQEEQLAATPGGQQKSGNSRSYITKKGYLDLGTRLTVAPSVKTEEEIYIRVVPELTSLTQMELFGVGSNEVSYPKLFTTRVRTEFTIRSGQTIAIGGLVNERVNDIDRYVPGLGSIPLVKHLFKYESKEITQTETIIFLTVKIVPGESLTASSGIPIRATLVQKELERILEEDKQGAEYSPKRAREILDKIAQDAKGKANKEDNNPTESTITPPTVPAEEKP